MNSTINKHSHLMEDPASRRKRKIRSYIFFIILFTIIIGSIILVYKALQQEIESELLSASSPERAIRAVCDLTPKPTSCFHSIWSIHTNFSTDLGSIKTTPSTIFSLSLHAAFDQLQESISANQRAVSEVKGSRSLTVLKGCDVLLRDSQRLINASITAMGVEPDDKFFKLPSSIREMKEGISNSTDDLDKCLAGFRDDRERWMHGKVYLWKLRMKVTQARDSLANSLAVLERMDTILGKFNQPFFGAFFEYRDLPTRLAEENAFGWVVYCSQYLALVLLICTVLRL